jgi:stress response protein YsnF
MFAAAMPVISREGIRGIIRPDAWLAGEAEGQIVVTFRDGSDYLISTEALHARLDGGYWVDLDPEQVREILSHTSTATEAGADELIIPVLQEEATLRIERTAVAKVHLHKTVQRRDITVQEPTYDEEVSVERRRINRIVEAPVPVRYEGDTMIIPVMEETLVVQKQYILKEEIHVTTTRRPAEAAQTYTVLSEEVTVERIPLTTELSSDGASNTP